MNNDLEQFSDLDLEGMAHGNNPVANAYRELLAFRRAAKQARPVAFTGSGSLSAIAAGHEGYIWGSSSEAHPIVLYTNYQIICHKCNGTGMADSGGTQPWGEPISVECDCTTPPAKSPAIPAGWKLVPIEPTVAMLDAGCGSFGTYDVYRDMLAAAPKPESE